MQIELTPFIADLLSSHTEVYKEIDKIYKENELEYMIAAKSSKFNQTFNNGSVEQNIYYLKIIGIIEYDKNDEENDINIELLLNKLADVYRFESVFIQKHDVINIEEYYNKLISNKMMSFISTSDFFNRIVALFIIAIFKNKPLDTKSKMYENIMKAMVTLLNVDKIHKEPIKEIKEMKNKVKELKKFNRNITFSANGLSGVKYPSENLGYICIDDISEKDRNELGIEYIYDRNQIDLDKISNIMTDNELAEVMYCYYLSHTKEEFKDINKINRWFIDALPIAYWCKAYKSANSFALSNMHEDILIKNKELSEEIAALKTENKSLSENLKKMDKEHISLNKEIKSINKELDKNKVDELELKILREYIQSNTNCIEEDISLEDMIDELNKLDIVVLGGSDNWIIKLKAYLKWTFLGTDNNFDAKILANKIVLIATDYNAHSIYYKALSNKDKCKDIMLYSGTVNTELSIKNLYNRLKQMKYF